MEATLIFAQTVFYFTSSLAIMVVGALFAIVAYHLIDAARELKKLSRKLDQASSEAAERIDDIIDRLSDFPVVSYFLKKRPKVGREKGREKSQK